MSRLSWKLAFVGVVVAVGLGSPLVLSAPDDAPPAAPPAAAAEKPPAQPAAEEGPAKITKQSYVGSNRCFECHRPQTNTWADSKHAETHARMPAQYRNDMSCLQCHATGVGQPSGYAAGGSEALLSVGCESCHGPGALHENAAQRFALADPSQEEALEKEMKETIVRHPSDAVCASCHKTEAHQAHPAFEGQQPKEVAVRGRVVSHSSPSRVVYADGCQCMPAYSYRPDLSAKSCGSCHYEQYKKWDVGSHASLASVIPAKYKADQTCQACHTPGHGVAEVVLADADATAKGNYINAACESCHGPGRNHVRFNMRYIASPPLGPQLEQESRHAIRDGKPNNTCTQCHLRESHKEHVEFDKGETKTASANPR